MKNDVVADTSSNLVKSVKHRSKYTLADVIDAAKKRNGFCLSTEIKSVNTIVHWKCEHGHEWKSRLSEVVNGNKWCRECSTANRPNIKEIRKKEPYTAAMIKKISKDKDGNCTTLENVSGDTVIRTHHRGNFVCKNGHTWESRYHVVLYGGWCARCVYDDRRKLGNGHRSKEHTSA